MTLLFLDGGDASGKNTVIQDFASRLPDAGYSYEVLHYPNEGSPIGQAIYKIIKDPVQYAYILSKPFSLQLLFEADRYTTIDKLVQSKESKKHILILNRFWPSGIAYSKANGLRGYPLEVFERILTLYPKPDFGFILDTSVSVAQARLSGRGPADSFESNLPMQIRVREELLSLAKKNHWFVLDGTQTPEILGKTIFDTVLNL